jgi:hypothetical protein
MDGLLGALAIVAGITLYLVITFWGALANEGKSLNDGDDDYIFRADPPVRWLIFWWRGDDSEEAASEED